jgi:hypothetical protein
VTLENLPCASWRNPNDFTQVELWDFGWTNDQLAAEMEDWPGPHTPELLKEGFERRLKVPVDVSIDRPVGGRGDTIYVVRGLRQRDPDTLATGE